MPQMLQEHFFFFSFLRLLDTCIFSVSHNISLKEKAQSDSGAQQSEKKQEPGHHETRTAVVGGITFQKQTSFQSQNDLGVSGLCWYENL